MTPRALITRALKKSGVNGVGQAPNATDLSDALDDLNDMFAQWQRRRWLITDLIEVVFSSTGKQFYTVGSDVTCDVVMTRPDQLEDAYFRLSPSSSMPVDYPLEILESREAYNQLSLKNQSGPSSIVYYDPAFPIAKLFIWPTPIANGSTEFHLFFKNNQFLTLGLDDNISLAPEYGEAMLYNLAARLRPSYQLAPDPSVIALAVSSLATIRRTNAQVTELTTWGLPGARSFSSAPMGGTLSVGGGSGSTGGAFRLDISQLDGSDTLL